MSEDDQSIKPPPPEPKLFKILCCPVNTKIGEAIVRELEYPYQENIEDKNIILGSLSSTCKNKVLDGVRKVIDIDDRDVFTKCLVQCDVVILDLFEISYKQIEYVIKTLKYLDDSVNKTLILVSSVKTWATSKPKEKKEGDEEGDDDVADDPDSQGEEGSEEEPENEDKDNQEADGEGEEEQVKKEYTAYTEKDYSLRKTFPCYRKTQILETLSLAAGKAKPSLKTFVLCPGLLYGNGEDIFFPYFQQGWLQHPHALTVYGEGKNKLPTIHYKDLAMHVKYLVYKPPRRIRYVLALDHTKKNQQKRIIQAVSKGMGTGAIISTDLDEAMYQKKENYDMFTLDLWLKPSRIFNEPLEEGEEDEDELNEEPEYESDEEELDDDGIPKKKRLRLKFDWHCKRGLGKNIAKLREEFNKTRTLKPNKIVIDGPPCSGRTHFSSLLAKFYNVPHITIKEVVKECVVRTDAFGEELRAHLETQKEEMMQEARDELEKKRNQGRKGLPEDINEDEYIPRLKDEYLVRCFKWRLMQNDCRNRGYVLDSYPKNYKIARKLFMKLKEGEDEENEDEENEEEESLDFRVKDEELIPGTVILFKAGKEYMMDFINDMEEEQVTGTHYNEDDLNRRLKVWKINNFSDDGSYILEDFYHQNKIDLLKINLATESQSDPLKSMSIFIERKGKFQNYKTEEADKELKRLEEQQEYLSKLEKEKEEAQKKEEEKEKEDMLVQEEEIRLKLKKLRTQEEEIVSKNSAALKNYFQENMRDVLVEALYDLSKHMPEDPIDHLADFLFKNAHKVPKFARGDI